MKHVVLILRWGLGLLFIVAGAAKVLDPAALHAQIEAYSLISGASSKAIAVYLPWLELSAGLAMLVRRWTTPAASLLFGLMLIFVTALVIAWVRNIDVACGCFGFKLDWPAGWLMIRDAVILCGLLIVMTFN